MAISYPKTLGQVSQAVAKAHRALKKLPDDYEIWAALETSRASSTTKRPPFLVVWKKRYGFLVHVASTKDSIARTAFDNQLFQDSETVTLETLAAEEESDLVAFSKQITKDLDAELPLKRLILFPNVRANTLDTLRLAKERGNDLHFLSLDSVSKETFSDHFSDLVDSELPEPSLLHLRRSFNPESIVPSSFTTSPEDTTARLTEHLLDSDQEWCAKNNLYLNADCEAALGADFVKAEGVQCQLVSGVAGSGKSLVLIYRAYLSAEINPNARILVLTHNKPLSLELKRRLTTLSRGNLRVDTRTFFQLAARHCPNYPSDIIGPFQSKRMINDILRDQPEISFTAEFLLDEVSFIKDNDIRKLSAYLSVARTGRKTRLLSSQRETIWKNVFTPYQHQLRESQKIDWSGVALRFLDAARDGKIPAFPLYDCILVDEAQFFAKSWFDCILHALKPGGHLFLSADPTQGFLKRRQSWIQSGIDVRGHAKRLKKPYRNSRQILLFARAFYRSRMPDDDSQPSDTDLPSDKEIRDISLSGEPPEIILCQDQHAEMSRISNEVKALIDKKKNTPRILILHSSAFTTQSVIEHIQHATQSSIAVKSAHDPSSTTESFCQVCSLNAGTGLEATITFFIGIDQILESENNAFLNDDEKAELRDANTAQLYVAFTRAGQRLIVTTTSARTLTSLQTLLK